MPVREKPAGRRGAVDTDEVAELREEESVVGALCAVGVVLSGDEVLRGCGHAPVRFSVKS